MEHVMNGYEGIGLLGWDLDSIVPNRSKVGNLYLKDKETESLISNHHALGSCRIQPFPS